MATASSNFLTGIGRIVQGDPFTAQTTNGKGEPLLIKSGVNAGKPTQKFWIKVAFSKNDPSFTAFWQGIVSEARRLMPQYFNPQGECIHPRFAWKCMDGDGVDSNGNSNATKEGFPGHWIIGFASNYAPKCYPKGKYDPAFQLTDPNSIKRGYYVRVSGTIGANIPADQTDVPGVFLNLSIVELMGFGQEIVSGPNAQEILGGAPPPVYIPQGMSETPLLGNNNAQPGVHVAAGGTPITQPAGLFPNMPGTPQQPNAGMPAMTLPGTPQQPSPGMPAMTLPAGNGPVLPNHNFVNNVIAPPQPQYVMLPAAQGYTREQWNAQGYSDDVLIANGVMQKIG